MPTDTALLIREFLEKLGVSVETIEEKALGPQTLYCIESKDHALLIGSEGETLRALNVLIRKMQERRFGGRGSTGKTDDPLHFLIDVNGHHAKRIEALQESARVLAERARLLHHDVEMPPMAAYERMIVHAFLAEYPEVTTQSAGEGKTRHIVIRVAEESAHEE